MGNKDITTLADLDRIRAVEDALTQPDVTCARIQGIGPNGPQIIGLGSDWSVAQALMLNTQDVDILEIFENSETGHRIDFHWGFTSENPKEKGQGLAKLLRWHPDVVASLDQIIKVAVVVSKPRPDRYILSDGLHMIVVSQMHHSKSKRWLVTAFNVGRKPSKRDRALLNTAKSKMSQATSRTVDGASIAGQTDAPISGTSSTDRLVGDSIIQIGSKINDK
jgi:hypothetical protein